MPRTTLNLDSSVMSELRRRSRREQKTLGELASELLARELHEEAVVHPAPIRWVSGSLGKPAVDLEDKEALRSLLDR